MLPQMSTLMQTISQMPSEQSTNKPQPFVLGEKQEAWLRYLDTTYEGRITMPEDLYIPYKAICKLKMMRHDNQQTYRSIAAAIRSSPKDYFTEST